MLGEFLFETESTPVTVRWIDTNFYHRNVNLFEPYTIVCSENYMKKLLTNLEQGKQWMYYIGGQEFGYEDIHITTSENAKDLSTDLGVKNVIVNLEKDIIFTNRREDVEIGVQLRVQELVLLYTTCICISIVVLFILGSMLSLESEQEKRYFTILRRIGMSTRQMRHKIVIKALVRSVIAVVAGWCVYWGYVLGVSAFSEKAYWDAVRFKVEELLYFGFDVKVVLILSFVCLVVPFVLSLVAKSKLIKGVKAI